MTHMGLSIVDRDPSDVDNDFRFLCHMILGLGDDSKGSEEDGRDFRFTDKDVSDEIEGRDRMAGDISDMDWLDFAMKTLSYPLRMNYFEMASQRSIRTVDVEREYSTAFAGSADAL